MSPYFFGGKHFCTNACGIHWTIGAIFVKFCQFVLVKNIKIDVATRCQILRQKCTKFNFGWDSAPDPAGGAYSAPPDPLTGFKAPTSKRRGGEKREGRGPLYFFSADVRPRTRTCDMKHSNTVNNNNKKCSNLSRGNSLKHLVGLATPHAPTANACTYVAKAPRVISSCYSLIRQRVHDPGIAHPAQCISMVDLYSALLRGDSSLKRSDNACDSKGITQFYLLSPTHEPYLPLLPSRRASPPFGWHSLRLSIGGMARLS